MFRNIETNLLFTMTPICTKQKYKQNFCEQSLSFFFSERKTCQINKIQLSTLKYYKIILLILLVYNEYLLCVRRFEFIFVSVKQILLIICLFKLYFFTVPVCPHAGGVGLCEMVQHLQIFDYIALSGTKKDRMIEFVDQEHEHFEDPVEVKNAHYIAPKVRECIVIK